MTEEFKHIVRIAGKDLSGERQVQLALSDLKGVNVAYARAVAYVAEVDPFGKLGELPKEKIDLRKDYDTGKDLHLVGTDVTVSMRSDIGRERRIRSRRGIRHELGLPVRGQRTRTTGRKGLVVGVKRKEIRRREEAAKAEKGRPEKAEAKGEKKEAKEKKAETKETKE
jgi:small subunit ribosomal protein S13